VCVTNYIIYSITKATHCHGLRYNTQLYNVHLIIDTIHKTLILIALPINYVSILTHDSQMELCWATFTIKNCPVASYYLVI